MRWEVFDHLNQIIHFQIEAFFNCSQTKFVAIILVLSVFFSAIFRLTDFSSDAAFEFLSSKTGSAHRALSALRAFQLCFNSNCFGDLWCEERKRG